MDALNDQDALLFFNLPHGLADQPVDRCGNLTRLQRASKGAGQSTGGRGYDIVQRGRMRRKSVGRNFIVLGDSAVDAENNRLRLRW